MSEGESISPALQALIDIGTKAKADERAAAVQGLLSWLDRRDQLAGDCSPGDALTAVAALLTQMRAICEPIMAEAFDGMDLEAVNILRRLGSPEQARLAELDLLQRKLWLATSFFDQQPSTYSMSDAAHEIAAIEAGDAPRLFATVKSKSRKGRPKNAFRIADSQLRALEWDAALAGRGLGVTPRRLLLQQAYGATWDTIAEWRTPCVRELGAAHVGRAEARAAADGAAGSPLFGERFGLSLNGALELDGSRYQAEYRARKTS